MMNKQQQSSFGSLVVTPYFLGVVKCLSVDVMLFLGSHIELMLRELATKVQLRAETHEKLLPYSWSRFSNMFSTLLAEALEIMKCLLSHG